MPSAVLKRKNIIMQVEYRNCRLCGAPLIGATERETEKLHKRGACLPLCVTPSEERSMSGKRGGTKRAQFLKEHTPLRHGEPPTRLPISKDEAMEARMDAIVEADKRQRGVAIDRDVIQNDRIVVRLRGARRVG